MELKDQEKPMDNISAITDSREIKNLIYVVRGYQVMLDKDLAMLYQVDTKVFNQAVSRNIERFPESFRFQLTKEEFDALRSQIVTSKGRGGRRYRPYMFTEQGIAMLSGILRSEVAIQVSIRIMNAFVELRHFITSNTLLFDRVLNLELKQLEYKKETDEKFYEVFKYIETHAESEQKIFYNGQIYDAFSLITSIIQKANNEIILVDGYVDVNTLNILSKKNKDVNVIIYTYATGQLTNIDILNFNKQYPTLTVKKTELFHDRFIILDKKIIYHIGASIKDAGKKCFGISLLKDQGMVKNLIDRINAV